MTKERIFRVQVGLLVGLLAFSLIPLPAFAAEDDKVSESILLSPTSKRYELTAGTAKEDTFKVINDGNTAFNFVVYARPYSVNDETYAPDFMSKAQNADAYKWIQFTQPSYHIEPGKTIEVGYTIRVPDNATPGGHYGVLFAETQPLESNEGTAILRKKRVGAILYATVKGDVNQTGSFEGVNIPFMQFKAPITIRQRVANSGNTDFTVNSSVTVSDIFGGIKYKASKDVVVLPSTTRAIINDWQNPSWMGLYKVDLTTRFLDTDKTSSQYVLLIPAWVYLTLVILIGARVLYAVAHRKRKRKK